MNRIGHAQKLKTLTVFDEETITAGNSSTSAAIELDFIEGFFSVMYVITGDGTLKLEYELSHDNSNFVIPSDATEIATSLTKTSGTSGVDVVAFPTNEPAVAPYMKIKATETGSSNSATLTLYLVMQ